MNKAIRSAKTRRKESGITLIEMMVAITVGLILLAGIVQLFVSNKTAFRIQEGANILNENARYALNQIQYHLRTADYWGGVEADAVSVDGNVGLTTQCNGTPLVTAIGIQGFDGSSAGSPLDCIPNADYVADTDVVMLRYADADRIGSAATVAASGAALWVRTAIGRRAVILDGADINTVITNNGDLADQAAPLGFAITNHRYRAVAYFIRPCASQDRGTAGVCDAQDDDIPTLARLVLDENGQLVQEDVVAGVEQMQIAYGIDNNGDLTADLYENADAVTANNRWDRVVATRLSLLIRNLERDNAIPITTANTTYRLMNGANGANGAGIEYTVPGDLRDYRRKLFNVAVQIRNNVRA